MAMSTNYSQTNTTAMTVVDSVTEWSDAGKAPGRPWDTSDPFISAYMRNLLDIVFTCYIRQIIVYIGLVGNALCWVVFWKQGLSDRINLLLFWLAVIDFFNLAFQIPITVTCYSSDRMFVNNVKVVINTKISRLFVVCGYVSGALIVVMSIERCLCVVIPFRARRLLTYRSMVTAVFLSYLIPFLAYLPLILGDSVKWREDPSTNRSMAYMVPTSWFPADRFLRLLPTYFSIVNQPLSFILVAVCSIITIIHLRRTSLKRSEMTGKASEERRSAADNRLTMMLLFICIVYVVLCLCQMFKSVLINLIPEFFLYRKYHNSFVVFYHVFVLTASCVNSTVNFCAYLVLSSRYRATLRNVVMICVGSREG